MRASDAIALAEVRQAAKDGTARQLRERADLSQAEVGEVCGVTSSAVAHWEAGDRVPRGEQALRYARLLQRLRQTLEGQEGRRATA